MTLLAEVQSSYRFHKFRSIRLIFKAGQLAAFCQADRRECPYPGNVPMSQRRKRTPFGAEMATLRRKAWLAGFDLQRKAMEGKNG